MSTIYWKQANNSVIDIKNMDDDHIKNASSYCTKQEILGRGYNAWAGIKYTEWVEIFEAEQARRGAASDKIKGAPKDKLNIKLYQYNAKNGVSTVIFDNDDMVMVKKSDTAEYCKYAALTAAIAKYMLGSQQQVVHESQNVKVIKNVN